MNFDILGERQYFLTFLFWHISSSSGNNDVGEY